MFSFSLFNYDIKLYKFSFFTTEINKFWIFFSSGKNVFFFQFAFFSPMIIMKLFIAVSNSELINDYIFDSFNIIKFSILKKINIELF